MAGLSVVVIGRNEAANLERCIASVRAMHYTGDKELIYVDSGSIDESPQIAATAGVKVIRLYPRRPTAALGRDAGWRASSAPLILFLDADCVIDPNFVTRALPEFEDPQIAVVFGRTREIDPKASIYHRVLDLQWWSPRPGPAEFCIGTALVRRSVLQQVNGYETSLMACEEPELSWRIRRQGYQILCLDVPMARHRSSITRWSEYSRRCTRTGYGFAEVRNVVPGRDSATVVQRSRRMRIVGSLLVLIPLAGTGLSLYLSSWAPLLIAGLLLASSVLRTAWNCRRRSSDPLSCVLFGFFSHWKEVPALWGQIRYFYDKLTGRRSLIEYKRPPRAMLRSRVAPRELAVPASEQE